MNRFGISAPYSQVLVSHSVSNPGLWIWIRIQYFAEFGSASRLLLIRIRIQTNFYMRKFVKIWNRKFFGSKFVMYVFFSLYKLCSGSSGMKFFLFFFIFEYRFSLPRSGSAGPICIRIQSGSGSETLVTGTTYIELAYDNFHSCRLPYWYIFNAVQMYLIFKGSLSFFPVSYCKYYSELRICKN